RLRTLLLPHELGNKIGTRVAVRVGELLPPGKVRACKGDAELATQLRLQTYLSGAPQLPQSAPPPPARELAPLAAGVDPDLLAAEIAALPAQALLASSGSQQVYCAPAEQLPHTLQELGRLRECTFRAVGEGTGRSVDIDEFDTYYEHLFIWNAAARE